MRQRIAWPRDRFGHLRLDHALGSYSGGSGVSTLPPRKGAIAFGWLDFAKSVVPTWMAKTLLLGIYRWRQYLCGLATTVTSGFRACSSRKLGATAVSCSFALVPRYVSPRQARRRRWPSGLPPPSPPCFFVFTRRSIRRLPSCAPFALASSAPSPFRWASGCLWANVDGNGALEFGPLVSTPGGSQRGWVPGSHSYRHGAPPNELGRLFGSWPHSASC